MRYQSATEMLADLKSVVAGLFRRNAKWQHRATATAAGLFALSLVVGAAYWVTNRASKSAPLLRSDLSLPAGFRLDPENASLALSPDGQKLALAAAGPDGTQQLWLRSMGDLMLKLLAGTEGATYPFWSPDGRYLGFFADQKLKKLEIATGTLTALCDATWAFGGSWSRQGMIVFAPNQHGPLYEVRASGGNAIEVTAAANGISQRQPHFLPDGKRLLFFQADLNSHQADAIYAVDLETQKLSLIAQEASEALFVQPGYLVFVRGRNLMAQPFDPRRLQASGDARPIAENVTFHALRQTGAYAFSETGLLVFQSGSGALRTQLTWFNASGQKLGIVGEPAGHTFVALSPDGKRALSEVLDANGLVSLRMHDLERGTSRPFTSGAGVYHDPVWSPDAKRVVYDDRSTLDPDYRAADGMEDYRFHWKAADGSEEARNPSAGGIPYSWSPDGRTLVFMSGQIGTPMSLLRVTGDAKPHPFIVTPAGDVRNIPRRGSFSPDGRWFCYLSDETGRYELYVAPFPGPGGKWRISSDGADDPEWVRGGAELVYINNQHQLVAVDIRASGQRLEIGQTHVLFSGRPLSALPSDASSYAPPVYLTADGSRILLPVPLEGSALSLTLVSNWIAQLRK